MHSFEYLWNWVSNSWTNSQKCIKTKNSTSPMLELPCEFLMKELALQTTGIICHNQSKEESSFFSFLINEEKKTQNE